MYRQLAGQEISVAWNVASRVLSVSQPQGNYIQRLMALYYMLDRESEAHIPALRDKVMMGALQNHQNEWHSSSDL